MDANDKAAKQASGAADESDTGRAGAVQPAVLRQYTFDIEEGLVVFRRPSPLSADSARMIEDWLMIILGQIRAGR